MIFKDLIQQRRSIRKFSDEKLSPEQVQLIMRAALMSPTSKNSRSWEFVLVEDKELLEKISLCKKHGSKLLSECALAIVVIANPLESDVWIEDSSIASIVIQLQAEDLGLGSCWVQIRNRETPEGNSAEEYIREVLDIPLHMQVLSVIAIGNKDQLRNPLDEEKIQWEKIHIEKYNYNKE